VLGPADVPAGDIIDRRAIENQAVGSCRGCAGRFKIRQRRQGAALILVV